MVIPSPNQGIPEQQGADPANLPLAQASWDGVMENRLAQRYASIADRAARNAAPNEGEISHLADVDREEIFDSVNWVSLRKRNGWHSVHRTTDAAPINASTVLVSDAVMVTALPTAGTFMWEDVIFYDSSAAGDFKIAYTWPAGTTNTKWGGQGGSTAIAGSVGDGQFGVVTVSGTSLPFGGAGVGTQTFIIVRGYIVMGGTAGNLQLQYAQQTSDATNTTVRAGTARELWRVA